MIMSVNGVYYETNLKPQVFTYYDVPHGRKSNEVILVKTMSYLNMDCNMLVLS